MSPQNATIAFVLGILGLFVLNRDRKVQTSPVLWIPVMWVWICGSRAMSQWLAIIGFSDAAGSVASPDQLIDGSPIDRAVFTALLVVGMVVLVRRSRQVAALLRANLPIVLFFLYCAVSIFWSDYPGVAFRRWIKALGDPVMVLIVLTDPNRTAAIKRFLARVGFLLVPLSILFIKYYGDLGRAFDSTTGAPMYIGITTGKNLLGMICLISIIAAEWSFFQAFPGRGRRTRVGPLVATGTLLAMGLWLFWLANSMTSLSCFLLASCVMAATRFRLVIRRPSLVHFFILAVVCVSASVLFLNLGGGVLETMGRDPTLTGRTGVWKLVLTMTGNPVFGTGFESFWLGPRLEKIWSVYWWHPNEAHNGYIEVFLNLGWVGVALFAALLITSYRNVFDAFRRDPEMGRLKLAYFVVAVVFNFTEAAMKMLDPVWILFLMAAIVVPGNGVRTKRSRAPAPPPINAQVTPCMEEV